MPRPIPLTPAEQHAVRVIAAEVRALLVADRVTEEIALCIAANRLPQAYARFRAVLRRGAFRNMTVSEVASVYGTAAEQAA
jgi:hypothetical protein